MAASKMLWVLGVLLCVAVASAQLPNWDDFEGADEDADTDVEDVEVNPEISPGPCTFGGLGLPGGLEAKFKADCKKMKKVTSSQVTKVEKSEVKNAKNLAKATEKEAKVIEGGGPKLEGEIKKMDKENEAKKKKAMEKMFGITKTADLEEDDDHIDVTQVDVDDKDMFADLDISLN